MSATILDAPLIESEPGGFCAKFTVDPSGDFPSRCFEALARHKIATRSLSIFRESTSSDRLKVTLVAGNCEKSDLREVLAELTQPPAVNSDALCGVP